MKKCTKCNETKNKKLSIRKDYMKIYAAKRRDKFAKMGLTCRETPKKNVDNFGGTNLEPMLAALKDIAKETDKLIVRKGILRGDMIDSYTVNGNIIRMNPVTFKNWYPRIETIQIETLINKI